MTWFAFTGGYGTMDLAGIQEKTAIGFGFHGYATQAEAEAKPNTVPGWNLPVKAGLNLLESEYKVSGGAGGPFGANSPIPSPGTVTSDAESVSNFLASLKNGQTWQRIGEGILGGLLIVVGVAYFAKNTETGQLATKAAKVVAK
jgi:hypothetical protein